MFNSKKANFAMHGYATYQCASALSNCAELYSEDCLNSVRPHEGDSVLVHESHCLENGPGI